MSDHDRLIEAICGRGWDAPVEPDLALATSLLASDQGLGASSIYAASAVGNVVAIEKIAAADATQVNAPGGPRDWPPLLYAAYSFSHQLELRSADALGALNALLKAGADPNASYSVPAEMNSFSALYGSIAVTKDRARTTALLRAGAAPSDGNSTYHAIELFDLDLVKELCAAGIEKEDLSYTVKHAIDMGWEAAIRLFLDHGADPNAIHPNSGETTLHWAIKRGSSTTVIEWLLAAGASIDALPMEQPCVPLPVNARTPYEFALRFGHVDASKLMEDAGARFAAPSEQDSFMHAVARGDREAAEALVASNAGIVGGLEERDRAMVPRWAQHGRREAVELALDLGFPSDGTAWMGLTATHWAALRGDAGLLKLLLAAGAPVVDEGGYFGTLRNTATNCQWYASGDYAAVLQLIEGLDGEE